MALDEQGRRLLAPYMTNVEDQVFAIKNLQGMVGSIMARYSRAETGLRETLLREFIQEDQLDLERASQLIERVLIAYGDDSVGELEGAHLSFEDISLLATKVIEHRRIGGSPIEQSTCYIRFDFKNDQGRYRYYRPTIENPDLANQYQNKMDQIFTLYGQMWQPLQDYLNSVKPIEAALYNVAGRGEERLADLQDDKERKAFERTYRMDIKTKTCDVLRGFLPLATQANVGLFGNGRYFQHLISKLWSSDLAEAKQLGDKTFAELSKVIPHYVKRARVYCYNQEIDQNMRAFVALHFQDLAHEANGGIRRIDPDFAFLASAMGGSGDPFAIQAAYDREMECSALAAMVYSYARAPFQLIRQRIQSWPESRQQELRALYYGQRKTRRDRPERALEFGYPLQFDLVTEWGVYKDLMRHRMGTMQIQDWVPDLGFEMPEEIAEAGLLSPANQLVETAESLFQDLDRGQSELRSYAFLQGHRMRWFLGMNDRALMHMVELRTTVQGHPNYRKACQDLHRLVEERFPQRAAGMNFVNHETVFWSRGESEARQRQKEAKFES